ncbi:hypothetical protein SDJN03_23248, partial [Cucurbita argyrosperma subsp. sororia]
MLASHIFLSTACGVGVGTLQPLSTNLGHIAALLGSRVDCFGFSLLNFSCTIIQISSKYCPNSGTLIFTPSSLAGPSTSSFAFHIPGPAASHRPASVIWIHARVRSGMYFLMICWRIAGRFVRHEGGILARHCLAGGAERGICAVAELKRASESIGFAKLSSIYNHGSYWDWGLWFLVPFGSQYQ